VADAFVAAAFFLAVLIRRCRVLPVRCWYATAGGTGGTSVGTGDGVSTLGSGSLGIGGAGATLGSGVKPAVVGATLGCAGKPCGTVSAGDGVGCVLVTVAKILASCWSAVVGCRSLERAVKQATDA
jgi:hypothetical protein